MGIIKYQYSGGDMRFTAIDFETANFNRHSACAVGIAVVNDEKYLS